ncbi:sphingosine/diacylglycerol kinase-like enzyme [Saccharomonospora marina XMU15]|uniref:Sphingosine/diacylglycerol kinase-like enzyme n=1 Tax=Saccharomonospora marina XMU15 TaxID=882083 RepID=H5X3R9_9PSEU|nr:diacylglycerol kinase family protein [Saccharomonospora marina]EHR51082.1 sphingosine/diacylglycerol kinase-like enzyme [Saccharomonospora marina XMU15]
MGLRVALAVHPDSGKGAAARVAGTVAARLRAATDRLDLLAANTVEESHALMREAHGAGLDAVVVLGGDGAAHQAVQFCAGTDIALGVVPSGTGNDLARALGMPADPLAAVDAVVASLLAGRTRKMDLGRLGDTWFSTVLCAGFDASVNARANRMRWPSGPRRYDLAVVAELASLRTRRLIVTTDTDRLELQATLVAVGNTGWYGGGIPICPSARADDGLFDLTVVGQAGRGQLIRMLPTLRTGKHLSHPAVHTLRAREVTLSGNDWPAYADGEPLGALPVTATCVPEALTVLD